VGTISFPKIDPTTMTGLRLATDGLGTEGDVCRRHVQAWAKPDARQIANFFTATASAQAPRVGVVAPEAVVQHREALFDRATLRQRCQEFAAGRGCAFLQWEFAGKIDSRPFTVGAAERLLLTGTKIAESRIYFDTLAFETFRDPSVGLPTIFDTADRGEGL
jgi:hypothetical protein